MTSTFEEILEKNFTLKEIEAWPHITFENVHGEPFTVYLGGTGALNSHVLVSGSEVDMMADPAKKVHGKFVVMLNERFMLNTEEMALFAHALTLLTAKDLLVGDANGAEVVLINRRWRGGDDA